MKKHDFTLEKKAQKKARFCRLLKPLLAGLVLTLMGLWGCADAEHVQHAMTGHTYGFWAGLWHGMVAFFSLIGSLFSDEITVYAINNNGGWYDLGFCVGAGILFGGSSKAAS